MIGKAIYKLLKNEISEFSTGGIYPVIMPQNPKESNNFPAVIYNTTTETIDSKDSEINMFKSMVEIQVVAKTYNEAMQIGQKIEDIFDHYKDRSSKTYSENIEVKGFKTINGYSHNYISNINISEVFLADSEDDYFDDLYLYSRTLLFDVYYYNNINKFSYDKGGSLTNPLLFSMDATQITEDDTGGLMSTSEGNQNVRPSNDASIKAWTNSIGGVKARAAASGSVLNFDPYFRHVGTPQYFNSTKPAYLQLSNPDSLGAMVNGAFSNVSLEFVALFIFVYRPTDEGQNLLLGDWDTAVPYADSSIHLDHNKDGSDITIRFNPQGYFDLFPSSSITLISTTNDTNYWDADIHYIALSVGGDKSETGGDKNQSGWFEYFNSNYNPNLTTGQILKNNSFTGNTNTYSKSCTFAHISGYGGGIGSAGFNLHEFLMFVPDKKTARGDVDSAPFQPTDIIYNQIKDYIYNKYENLK